jgi:RNA polymerase sigma factor (sigma-70 family)
MAAGRWHKTLGPLRKLAATQIFADRSDGALLEQFVSQRDDAAFAELVQRHRHLVGSVCRHLLRHEHDAEDAFQAAFLILAMKGRSIRKRQALSSWLHGVAFRCAMRIKRQQARRQRRELQAARVSSIDPAEEINLRELWAVLETEIQRLPERHRAPFVLCCLEGKTQEEAGRMLGWKIGTVSGRLARARQELQRRLAHKGIALAAVLGATALGKVDVSAATLRATVRGGAAVLSGAAASSIPTQVLAIVQGVNQAMCMSRIQAVLALVSLIGLLAGAGLAAQQALFQDRAEPKDQAGKLAANLPAAAGNEPAKHDLRYDGKPFEYWRDFGTNELKAERRIDAVRAMGAFGVRGYAAEGAEVIVRIIREYSETDIGNGVVWVQEPSKFPGTPDQRVVLEASLALAKIGPAAAPVLLKNLDASTARTFSTQVFALGVLSLPESLVPNVMRLICEGNGEIRAAALLILLQPSSEERWRAVLAAAKAEGPGKLVQALGRLLPTSPSTQVDDLAAELLGRLGSAARPAGPALVAVALKGSKPALEAVRNVRPDAKVVVALASTVLEKELNQAAADLLGDLGVAARSATPVLVAALKFRPPEQSGDGFERWVSGQYAVLMALGKIAPDPEAVVSVLARVVGDKKQDLRLQHAAFELLMRIDTDLEPRVPALTAYLERLWDVGGGPAEWSGWQLTVDPLSEASNIMKALQKLGPKARAALPTLSKGFEYKSSQTKLGVLQTWTALGSAARDALPLLYQYVASLQEARDRPGAAAHSVQELRDAAQRAIKSISQ